MERHKIILDIDNAITLPAQDTDDAMALALALTSPEIEMLGITTCAGNCRTWQSTENTLRMLELAGRGDIPVAAGREYPLVEDVEPSLQYLERKTAGRESVYWEGTPPPAKPTLEVSPLKAHELIIETVKANPGEVTIVKEGSLTNLALALLVAPEIASQVKSVVHMGGSMTAGGEGGTPDIPGYAWRHILRFNSEFDPHALEIVVRSGIPFTFVPGFVTVRVFQYLEDLERIREMDTPYHQHLYEYGKPWVEWSIKERRLRGAHMHDPLTLAAVFEPDFFRFVTLHCDLARFRKWDYPYLYMSSNTPQVRVAVDVHVEPFERFLADRLASPVLEH